MLSAYYSSLIWVHSVLADERAEKKMLGRVEKTCNFRYTKIIGKKRFHSFHTHIFKTNSGFAQALKVLEFKRLS